MVGVRHSQPQHVPRLQLAELVYTNRITRKCSAIYIKHCLSLKWLIRIPQAPHWWYVRQLLKHIYRENLKRGYEVQIEGAYPSEKSKGQEGIFKKMTNLLVKRVWKKNPIIQKKNTYNYTLSHLNRVRGFQYLRHICADQMWRCKCPSSCGI